MPNNKHQRANPFDCKRFWIIGAGRFGRIAAKRITRHLPAATVSVVDKLPFTISGEGITMIVEDGIQWLNTMLDPDAAVDWIVPAIPFHVAVDWLKLNLKHLFHISSFNIPDAWLSQMPHALRGNSGQAFVSHADFVCPDNCPEPKTVCTYTGKTRPMDLFRLLGALDFPDVLPIVLRSHQLYPGVGAILPADLILARDTACKNSHRPLMIATACRCHGVVDFLRLESRADTADTAERSS